MSRYPVLAVLIAAILQCLPQTAFAVPAPHSVKAGESEVDPRAKDLAVEELQPRAARVDSQLEFHAPEMKAVALEKSEAPPAASKEEMKKLRAELKEQRRAEQEEHNSFVDRAIADLTKKYESLTSSEAKNEKRETSAPKKSEAKVAAAVEHEEDSSADEDENEAAAEMAAKKAALAKKPSVKNEAKQAPAKKSADEVEEEMVTLDLKSARKALGSRFGLKYEQGKFFLKGFTTPECAERIEVGVSGTELTIQIPKSCETLPAKLSKRNAVDLSTEAINALKMPSGSAVICLMPEPLVDQEEDDKKLCAENALFKVVGKDEAKKEKEAKLAEANEERADALLELVNDCGASASMNDKITAYQAVKLSSNILGKDQTQDILEEIRGKVADSAEHDVARVRMTAKDKAMRGVVEVLQEGSEASQLKALKLKAASLYRDIFDQPDLSLAERKELYEDALNQLEQMALGLNISPEQQEAMLKKFTDGSLAALAKLGNSEKGEAAAKDVSGAFAEMEKQSTNPNNLAFEKSRTDYIATLNKHGQALGCFTSKEAQAGVECQRLQQAAAAVPAVTEHREDLIDQNQRNFLTQACNNDRAKDPNAKCDILTKFEESVAQKKAARDSKKSLVSAPVQLGQVNGAAATTGAAANGVDLATLGSNQQFYGYSASAANTATTATSPAASPAVTSASPAAVAPAAAVSTRRPGGR